MVINRFTHHFETVLFTCVSNRMSDKCIVVFQIDNEFMPISTEPLISIFFAELDWYSLRMMQLFSRERWSDWACKRFLFLSEAAQMCKKMPIIISASVLLIQIVFWVVCYRKH